MKNKLPIVLGIILLFGAALGFLIWQKSQVKPQAVSTGANNSSEPAAVKKVDLSTQPAWVQQLDVTLTRGTGERGLDNFTFKVNNLPANTVSTISYVANYQTSDHGAQGGISLSPIDLTGKTSYSKTINFGSCSTASCVYYHGITSVDLELDFVTTSGDKATWEKTLPLP